ncbi:YraN family protein [Sulfurospirillum sp. 1612]|uniref:YraN family protein n=1 Tax=Sulfurospirillum sp. 1612 TaxID=3094835 RepID=UPI002F9399B8
MSLEIGNKAEERVTRYLQSQGYTIIDRNFHSRFGEIDIIAEKNSVLEFIEVKYSKEYDPLYRITPKKMEKIIKTIHYFLMLHPQDKDYQISAALVNDEHIEFLENIS